MKKLVVLALVIIISLSTGILAFAENDSSSVKLKFENVREAAQQGRTILSQIRQSRALVIEANRVSLASLKEEAKEIRGVLLSNLLPFRALRQEYKDSAANLKILIQEAINSGNEESLSALKEQRKALHESFLADKAPFDDALNEMKDKREQLGDLKIRRESIMEGLRPLRQAHLDLRETLAPMKETLRGYYEALKQARQAKDYDSAAQILDSIYSLRIEINSILAQN